ncbi:MAG: helix-hairpin-helix domain-containing protein [Jatrophihabitantaceae bacterium]
MRGESKPGRGERGRVARRVRAMLADSRPETDPGSGVDPPSGEPPLPPWLPSDDLTALPAHPVRPPTRVPAETGSTGPARRSAGLITFLAQLPLRTDPGRRGAIAVGVAAFLAAVITGGWVLSTRPRTLGVTSTGAHADVAASAQSAAASAGSLTSGARPRSSPTAARAPTVVVDIAGKVRHPGVYHLPTGSRVDDALRAAGGALPDVDLSTVNLAARVADGQQIAVGMPGATGGSGGGVGASGSAPAVALDLNTATLEQLETLPGVGPVLGQHILDWRAAHGPFVTIDQLREVSGIGEVKFAALRSRLSV